jgi:hypothetical protein
MLRGIPINYEGTALVSTVGSVTVGGETFVSDLTKTYIKFKLLHSFPVVNANGMTFTPENIARSIFTAVNQPLNLGHNLEGNPVNDQGSAPKENLLVGSMLKANTEATTESPILPDSPFVAEIIGVLWNRSSSAIKVIESLGEGESEYKVSMEAIRNAEHDGWYVKRDGEWHYVASLSEAEFTQWQNKEFDKVALAVGGTGEDGTTNFWGGGFTLTPADDKATIDDVLVASFGNCAIAAVSPSEISSDKNKENNMKMTLKQLIAAVAAGFEANVSGNDLSLTVGDSTFNNPDFYMYGSENGDGSYSVYASLTVKIPSDNGMEETRRFEYDGTLDSGEMAQVEAAQASVKTPSEMQSVITQLEEANASVEKKYVDYVSKEDADQMVKEAVEAALAKAKEGDGDMGDKITKDEAAELAAKEVKKAMDVRDAEETALASRSEQIESNGFTLTPERKEVIASMPISEEGDKAFKSYLEGLIAGRTEMEKELKGAGIDVDDAKGVKASIASFDNAKSTGFKALMIAFGDESGSTFSPALTPEAASQNTESFV